jgi:branched-chain amino acid transport system substrate-binding protein
MVPLAENEQDGGFMIRSTKTWRALAVTAAAGIALSACGTTNDNKSSSGPACDQKIAFMGALSGPAAALGINAVNGVELAVEQYNAAHADCKVTLVKSDSQSDPKQAPGVAKSLIDDKKVIGVVGPLFSGESKAADPLFNEAKLSMITASATNPGLANNGWTYFHRILGNDATQGPSVSKLLTDTVHAKSVFVIDDASEYGKGLADIVKGDLGKTVVGSDTIEAGKTDFPSTVTAVKSANPDAAFYGGYYAEASLLIKQLRDAGWKGIFVVGDGVKDPEYVKVAKAAAEGTLMTCPCVPGDTAATFLTDYKAKFNTEPGTYSPEGFDAANVFLNGIADGITDRVKMNDYVSSYDKDGITKHIKFDAKGESAEIPIWAYEVKDGQIVKLKQLA